MIDFTKLKLIIWDLDETLWVGTLSDNESVQLKDEFVSFIGVCLDRGIVHSICSKNDFESAKEKLISFHLWDLFVFPSINWNPKGERIRKIVSDMKLRSENVLFVDDNISNLHEAKYFNKELQVCTPDDLFKVINAVCEIKKVDKSRPRLAQYRMLEEKSKSRQDFSSNEDFLMSCDIRVEFHNDCLENLDRIHELILRSNQLNYTKFRQGKEELRAALTDGDTRAEYITVKDSFGDYGIVGFYMIAKKKIIHYLFSCRTLGMLVEQYVYMKIGCPAFDVIGDVITQLNKEDVPAWINQNKKMGTSADHKSDMGGQVVLFKGPCDISQIFSFIKETSNIKTEFTYVNNRGISVEGHNHTSQFVTSLMASPDEKSKLISEIPWLDEEMLEASSWKGNDAIVFSMLTDGNLGIYEHKETGYQIALCEKYYDITDERNWDDYINQNIFTSQINFTREQLVAFSQKCTYINNSAGEITLKNLDVMYDALDQKTKLILILGSEIPFKGVDKPSYADRHLFHKIINEKIRNWAKDKENVHLIEVTNYITSQKDYTDTINHFQKKVYYQMAQDIIALLGQGQTPFKVKSRGYLYAQSFRKSLSDIKRRIIRKR